MLNSSFYLLKAKPSALVETDFCHTARRVKDLPEREGVSRGQLGTMGSAAPPCVKGIWIKPYKTHASYSNLNPRGSHRLIINK